MAPSNNDDSDLDDLIAKAPVGGAKTGRYAPTSGGGGGFLSMTPCGFIWGACRLCMYKCPGLSMCGLFFLFMAFISLLSVTIFNPTMKMGIMGADYSAIQSAFELSLSKVDHWCIQGDSDSCKCENPLEASPRSELKSWNVAHKANVADVDLYRAVYGDDPTLIDESTGKSRPPIDVAFVGESVVEAMDGRWLGKRMAHLMNGIDSPEARKKPDIGKVFDRLFRKENGGPVEGVALGIAGDSTANVLWRLQHDEMPYDFNPKVWWLVLGMNDLTRMKCSEEIVVLGILRIVEEIRLRKPDAKIVINSMLPMIQFQKEGAPKMADFADFKTARAGKTREVNDIVEKTERGEQIDENTGHKRKLRKNKKANSDKQEEAVDGKELEKALENQKMVFEKGDKHFHDKVFADMEKYHPKAAVSPLIPMIKKKIMPPVWPSVHLINDKLKEFCQKHDNISFFDATTIFAQDLGRGRHKLRDELISPRGHPSELGFAAWENRIMGKLNKLIIEKEQEDAEAQDMMNEEDEDLEDPDEEEEDVSLDTALGSADEEDAVDGEEKKEEDVSPETAVGSANEEEVSGDGEDNLSEGKENEPPKLKSQPSRDDSPSEEEDGEVEEAGKEVDGEVEEAKTKSNENNDDTKEEEESRKVDAGDNEDEGEEGEEEKGGLGLLLE